MVEKTYVQAKNFDVFSSKKWEWYFVFPLGRIYILTGLPMKEWNWGGNKLSEGQLFTFRDRQDNCLPSAARLDSTGDQGKGKVGP